VAAALLSFVVWGEGSGTVLFGSSSVTEPSEVIPPGGKDSLVDYVLLSVHLGLLAAEPDASYGLAQLFASGK